MVTGLICRNGKVSKFVLAPVASTLKRAAMGCAKKSRATAAMKFGDQIRDLHVNARPQGFRWCYRTPMLLIYEALGVKSARSLSILDFRILVVFKIKHTLRQGPPSEGHFCD
jgi:hypothetical protein